MTRISLLTVAGAQLLALAVPAAASAASSAPPAGGAATDQIVGATAAAILLTAGLLVFGLGHRTGRVKLLGTVADQFEAASGLPGWAALPAGLAGVSLLSALFGVYWDISLHIDNGRDPGPLANPAHYFILAGLFGLFSAGWFAIVLPKARPGAASLKIAPDWYAPIGAVLLMACSSFALLGFPLDDFWHRMFGQDVTLWGPTHLMMISGAVLSLLGIVTLLVEGWRARPTKHGPAAAAPALIPQAVADRHPAVASLVGQGQNIARRIFAATWQRHLRLVLACGGLLIGLSLYQGEFEFGVPQYRLLYDPVLVALSASVALVMARVIVGRGGALAAVAFFLGARLVIGGLVDPILGETFPHFALYLPEAVLVEAVALTLGTRAIYRFGLVSGLIAGTLGVVAETAWSHIDRPLPWPWHELGLAIALAVPVALAGGTIGAFLGGAISSRSAAVVARPAALRGVVASVAAIVAVLGYLGPTSTPAGATAAITLTDVNAGAHRTVQVLARVSPASVAHNVDWVTVTAWQGRGHLVVDRMRRIGDGVYRSTQPIPVYGSWKAAFRVHAGRTMASVPIYLPEDAAIPARLVPAAMSFTRPFDGDQHVLQRERKRDVPGWLWGTASLLVLGLCLSLIGLIGWALVRLVRADVPDEPTPRSAPARPTPARPSIGVTG